ncbi:MAG: DUF1330 domain-containing protein [Geminicoccaceae bacterium]
MAAYMLAQLDIHDLEKFQRYRDKVSALVEQFGGRYLVRGGEIMPLEGELKAPRLVIIEFADKGAAERWYHSPEYQEILPLRLDAASGSAVIVEGL